MAAEVPAVFAAHIWRPTLSGPACARQFAAIAGQSAALCCREPDDGVAQVLARKFRTFETVERLPGKPHEDCHLSLLDRPLACSSRKNVYDDLVRSGADLDPGHRCGPRRPRRGPWCDASIS